LHLMPPPPASNATPLSALSALAATHLSKTSS
jgi:hypothetical protein